MKSSRVPLARTVHFRSAALFTSGSDQAALLQSRREICLAHTDALTSQQGNDASALNAVIQQRARTSAVPVDG